MFEQNRPSDPSASRRTSSRRVFHVPFVNVYGTYCAKTLIVCIPSGTTLRSCALWKYSSHHSASGNSPRLAAANPALHSAFVSGALICP